jgi:hypothetical protein
MDDVEMCIEKRERQRRQKWRSECHVVNLEIIGRESKVAVSSVCIPSQHHGTGESQSSTDSQAGGSGVLDRH